MSCSPASSGAGGDFPPTLRGPFSLVFNTPLDGDGFAVLGTIPAGSVLIVAWLEVVTTWNGITPRVELGIGTAAGLGTDFATYDKFMMDVGTATAGVKGAFARDTTFGQPATVLRAASACVLAALPTDGGGVTQGSAKAYALTVPA